MTTDVSKYEYIEKFFNDILPEIDETHVLKALLGKNSEEYLKQFDEMLEALDKKSNMIDLIKNNRERLKDPLKFLSFLSETRAGFYLLKMGFPVEFIPEGTSKTPDIKTEIDSKTSYIEVKMISKRKYEQDFIIKELRKYKIHYVISIDIEKPVYSASDVVKKLLRKIPKGVKKGFPITDEFEYGVFTLQRLSPNLNKHYITVNWSYEIPYKKEDAETKEDAIISTEEIINGIKGDIGDAVAQLVEYSDDADLRFILLDNKDIGVTHYNDVRYFLYGNRVTSGWFDYSADNKYINGIFFMEGGIFYCQDIYYFPNKLIDNYSELFRQRSKTVNITVKIVE